MNSKIIKINSLSVSVVIPALNESKSIKKTVMSCKNALKSLNCNHEIVVVDDGSTDDTSVIAEISGATTVRQPMRGGYGLALKRGIQAAKYDTIVITDADGTYPVADIPKLLDEYCKGFNMVVGARTGCNYKQSCFKSGLRNILKFLVEWASGQKIPDINSGFRVFSKKECMPFFQHLCNSFSFTTSITLAYMMSGLFVGYVPTQYFERVGSSHVRLFGDSLRTLGYILRQILYFDPLKIFMLFAGCWFILGMLGFVSSAVFSINAGYYLGILSTIGAFLLLGIGLLAEQMRQIVVSIQDKR